MRYYDTQLAAQYDYLQRIFKLYQQVESWLAQDSTLKVDRNWIEIQAGEQSYQVPTLSVQRPNGPIVMELKPLGYSLPLSEGVLSVENWWEMEQLIFLSEKEIGSSIYEGVQQSGWYWERLNRRPHYLNQTTFWELVHWVDESCQNHSL